MYVLIVAVGGFQVMQFCYYVKLFVILYRQSIESDEEVSF